MLFTVHSQMCIRDRGIIRSKMNGGGNSVPPPSPDAAPADNNPFGAPIPEGLL